jgi:hypothetical protein
MLNFSEPMESSHRICPIFDSRALHFNCFATLSADYVVVMIHAAFSIERLTIWASQYIEVTRGRKSLEGSINRGETELLPLSA